MNISRLKLFLDRVLLAEDSSGVGSALSVAQQAFAAYGQQANGASRIAAAKARDELRFSAELLRESLSDPVGKEAVEFFQVKHQTIYLGDDIENLISQTESSPSLIAGRLSAVQSERNIPLNNMRVVQSELIRLGISSDEPKAGEVDLGFMIPRSYFDNSLKHFSIALRQIDDNVEAFSILATGKAQRAELGTINTSNPLFFLGVDPVTAHHIVEAFNFMLGVVRDLAAAKQGIEMARGLFSAEAVKEAEEKLDKQIEAKIVVEVERQLKLVKTRESDEAANDITPRLTRAYKSLFLEIEGGVQLKVRAGINGDVDAESVQALTTLLEKASQLQFPAAAASPASRITDARAPDHPED